MKRVIVDYKKLNAHLLQLLVDKFPYGYDDTDIVTFRNPNYELIEAVEVRTEDTIYLVKISKHLADSMEKFDVITDDEVIETEAEKEEDDEILASNRDPEDDDNKNFDDD